MLGRPVGAGRTGEGIELTGHHEILLPLLHAVLAGTLAEGRPESEAAVAA